jgi:hypothetical protein
MLLMADAVAGIALAAPDEPLLFQGTQQSSERRFRQKSLPVQIPRSHCIFALNAPKKVQASLKASNCDAFTFTHRENP